MSAQPAAVDADSAPREGGETLLRFDHVHKSFVRGGRLRLARRGRVSALDGVTLEVRAGECVGLIGESGSGKSTLARLALGLIRPDRGSVEFEGVDFAAIPERRLREVRARMHLVFQDPYDALSPRKRVHGLVAEPMLIHGIAEADRDRRVLEALAEVDLEPVEQFAVRYPHELSGGQRQRVALARALVLRPRLIVADEPTSMLDVSLRAGLLRLMLSLREHHGIAFLFITHDLALARLFCDRVAVLFRGRVVELGPTENVVADPRHPYTRALMRAVRDLSPSQGPPEGSPSIEVGTGCAYADRCPLVSEICAQDPPLRDVAAGHSAACHFAKAAEERSR